MTNAGDGDDDDPELGAMRGVWRAMSDEDPSSRGLAELMAAARVKAEALASPPWWRRALDLLRRPTILALASIMVLIGGAVLVTKHAPTSEEPTIERAPARDQTMQGSAAIEVQHEPAAAEKAPATTRETAIVPVPASPPAAPPKLENPRPTPPHVHATAPESRVPPPSPPPPPPKAADSVEDDANAEAPAGTRGPTRVLIGELLQQCRSAATRGDCEAAKLIAKRIANRDASYYREHVSTDAAISKCVTSE